MAADAHARGSLTVQLVVLFHACRDPAPRSALSLPYFAWRCAVTGSLWTGAFLCPGNDRCGSSTGSCIAARKIIYSITSSARRSKEVGTARPSALAVFMLMTSSNLVGCSTGRSEGLVPLRILST